VHHITMLGSGLIGMFYTKTLHGRRSRDEVRVVFSRAAGRARQFASDWGIRDWTTNMEEAINHPDTDVVVIGLPNNLHEEATIAAAAAGKAVLCTKPLGRTAAEAKRMLDAVERAGVFAGYLEDLVYTPDTLKAVRAVRDGALGRVLWVRSRETHGGPHSEWFWDREIAGGGAIVDMGCHCIEIGRSFIGKEVRPLEVMCWADTQVHPITAEDSAVGLVRYATGAIAQFEVSWTFRGGMDLRDEVSGAEGTIRLDHWLRTGHEMFTAARDTGYVSEKAESETGWLFPVGDEIGRLGYVEMFADMLNALDTHEQPLETFYDGYVVNAIMDAAYRSVASKQWEPVELDDWRGSDDAAGDRHVTDYDADHLLIKREKMPDGTTKLILKEKHTGAIVQRVI
jgi:predicted dehydrogenase